MRWEALFGDLEAQLEAADAAELAGEVADRARWEAGQQSIADRLRAAAGQRLTIGLAGAGVLEGTVDGVGPDWVLLRDAGRSELLAAAAAVLWVSGLGPHAAPAPDDGVSERLGLGYALRVIARDRSPVTLALRDGTVFSGTLDRVGSDFVDLAEHPAGEPRRAGNVRGLRTISLAALALVRAV
ncbi:MAG: hypothetical protein JO222_00395 [Frankiales bacterium]|nr:hypothetical protein [Frankiales bacterium]